VKVLGLNEKLNSKKERGDRGLLRERERERESCLWICSIERRERSKININKRG
jgi:hypothetical protein